MSDNKNEDHHSDYYYDKGVEYFEAQNYIASLAFFERARELGKSDIGIDGYTAEAYKKIEEYEKSLVFYNKVIAQLEQNPVIQDNHNPIQFYSDRAFIFIALDRYDEAITEYTRAIEIESDEASSYNGRAQAHYMKENYADALLDMSKALFLDDNSSWYWERRASIFLALGKNEQAAYDTFRAYLCQCTSSSGDEESRSSLEDNIIFTERNFSIEQNAQGEIVFHISNYEYMPSLPEIFYDGGSNALLRRRFDQFIFLDTIPSNMRKTLLKADAIFITEIITVDDENNKLREDEYNTLYYKTKVRKHPADASLDSIDAVKEAGYFFFACLASRIRSMPDRPVNQIIGIEDYANLAAVLAREEDYESLQRFHDTILEGNEGSQTFAVLALNKRISAAFRNWQPTPIFYVTARAVWSSLKDGIKMLRFLASFPGADLNIPSGEGDTVLYNQCLKIWQPEILRTN